MKFPIRDYRLRLFAYLAIAYALLIPSFYQPTDQLFHTAIGIGFTLAIAFAIKATLLRKVIFVGLSIPIYFFSLMLLFINSYFGPIFPYILIGTVTGALLEVLLFTIVFGLTKKLKIEYLIATLFIGAYPIIWDSMLSFWIGIAVWWSGVALIMYRISRHLEIPSAHETE